ncbi:hypothetical protein ABMA27_000003 [Loxostege sticticalis]|uniref:C3H1-type domain-containing protein n=1 Tax=Loxostege sticticalis TaxID=481309 RepID=A0ABR3ILZ2_LOXSC
MQSSDTDKDDTINFRPSPNFKHMKKYFRSKYEGDQNEIESKNKVNPVVQPPLPPNSPPPDSPITLKQEVEDDGYERPLPDDASADAPGADADAAPDAGAGADAPPAEPDKHKFIMCKDWVRGTCSRGAACIYVHKLDKSQLKGVYRFCRDFENSRCERQVCYFAHATTFEKEHFFRTAYLPPHALHHLKSAAPQPAGFLWIAVPEMPLFANPPPPALTSGAVVPVGPGAGGAGGAGAGGGAAVAGAGALEARLPLDAFAAAAALPAVSLKREWRDQDDFGSPSREERPADPLVRACKSCDITTMRLQHSKAQVAAALRSSQELDDKLEQVIKKNDRLHALLKTLLKPSMKMLLTKILLGSEARDLPN